MKIRFQADEDFNEDIVSGVLRRVPEIDLPLHFGRFIETDVSPGVFIVSQRAGVPEIIEDLILIWVASETEEYTNSIRTLPL